MMRKESGEHTTFLICLLSQLCQSGEVGVTMDDIKALYCDRKNSCPCDKTIKRAIMALNVIFDPYTNSDSPDERTPKDYLPIRVKTMEENGVKVRRYVFAKRGLFEEKVGASPKPTAGLALSLYSQKKQLREEEFAQLITLLTDGLTPKNTNPILVDIQKYVYVSGFSPAQTGRNLQSLLRIFQAIQRRWAVRFNYTSASTGELTKQREINPYGLVFRHGVWYLAGVCRDTNERRIFRIDHMDRLSVMESNAYTIPADFSLERIYGQSWGIWTESKNPPEPELVELEVAASVASHFEAICYHASQDVKKLDDGRLRVTFTVSGAIEMLPWILGWGACMRVIQPEWIRQKVVDSAKNVLSQYGQAE